MKVPHASVETSAGGFDPAPRRDKPRLTIVPLAALLATGLAAAWGLAQTTSAAQTAWETAPQGGIAGALTFSRKRPSAPVVIYLERQGEPLAFRPPAPAVIRQENARFWPAFQVVVVGQEISFDNDEPEDIDHNVYSLGAAAINLGIFPRGEKRGHRFDVAGEVNIHCSIHQLMDARLLVVPQPAYALVEAEQERYDIPRLPAGRYLLKSYQPTKRFRDVSLPVEIRAGETIEHEVRFER